MRTATGRGVKCFLAHSVCAALRLRTMCILFRMSRESEVYGFHNPLATLPRRAFSSGHIQRLDGGGTFAGVDSAEAAWLPLLRITDLCRPACAVLMEHQRAALHHPFRVTPTLINRYNRTFLHIRSRSATSSAGQHGIGKMSD